MGVSAEEDQAVDGDSISVFLVLASRSEWTLCVARRISGVAGLGQVYTTGFTSVAFWRLARVERGSGACFVCGLNLVGGWVGIGKMYHFFTPFNQPV